MGHGIGEIIVSSLLYDGARYWGDYSELSPLRWGTESKIKFLQPFSVFDGCELANRCIVGALIILMLLYGTCYIID